MREDAALAEALSCLDIGKVVPPELYVAVAEALVWAYRLDARAPEAALRHLAVQRLVLERRAQRALELGVDLADAALGDPEDLADLAEVSSLT